MIALCQAMIALCHATIALCQAMIALCQALLALCQALIALCQPMITSPSEARCRICCKNLIKGGHFWLENMFLDGITGTKYFQNEKVK